MAKRKDDLDLFLAVDRFSQANNESTIRADTKYRLRPSSGLSIETPSLL